MVQPVPGYAASTPYGRRGPYWSCDEDSAGNGIHTGADYAAPAGAQVVAARPGTVAHVNYGSAFGYHQLAVRCSDGTEDFYAHLRSRAAHGQKVDAGQKVGEVGAEGNVSGAHLHFERHKAPGWSCTLCVDPAPSVNYQPAAGSGGSGAGTGEDMPEYVRVTRSKALSVKAATWVTLEWEKVANGADYADPGGAHLKVGGMAVVVTLTATVEQAGTQVTAVRSRYLEREKQGDGWVTGQTWPAAEHARVGDETQVLDTRSERVTEGRRLVAQVFVPDGGKLTTADLSCLAW